MRVQVTTEVDFGKLRRPRERAADARPAFTEIVDLWRANVVRELDSGSVDGQRWPPKQPFGDEAGGPSRLQKTGVLRRAWLGGPGSFTRIGPGGGQFGIDGDRIPYAAVHRGTSGPIMPATFRAITRVRVTPRMRRFLAAAKGVYLRETTRWIVIPARPHGASQKVCDEAARIYREHLLGDDRG